MEPKLGIIEHTAQALAIKPKVLSADIKDMAWAWEETVGAIRQPSPKVLVSTLRAITKSYLRGHGVRMGNYQGIKQHERKLVLVMISITDYVISDNVFESLHQAGITSVNFWIDIAEKREERLNILDEVKRLLDGEP